MQLFETNTTATSASNFFHFLKPRAEQKVEDCSFSDAPDIEKCKYSHEPAKARYRTDIIFIKLHPKTLSFHDHIGLFEKVFFAGRTVILGRHNEDDSGG